MATETFANLPSTTVSSGGTDAPSGGTSQSWTVASSASFPAAVTGVTQFHISDPAQPSEIITVTNISGTTWTVTRGAEGTTPVAHTAGFTVKQVVTAGFLTSLSPVSGQYLCPPTVYAPGTQTTLTTSGTAFAAMSSTNVNTGNFIAPPSGSVVVTASFVGQVSSSGNAVAYGLCAHGSVSPLFGYVVEEKQPVSTQPYAHSIPFPVPGLAAGTYNFDLMVAVQGGGTASVFAFGQTGTPPTLGNAGVGAPVVMTVQAV